MDKEDIGLLIIGPIFFASILNGVIPEVRYFSDTTPPHISQYYTELVNKCRGHELKWSPTLYQIAKERAEDMKNRMYFAHEDPFTDEVQVEKLAEKYGVGGVGENIFMMQLFNEFWKPAGEQAIIGWLNSPLHSMNTCSIPYNYGAIVCHYNICVFVFAKEVPDRGKK